MPTQVLGVLTELSTSLMSVRGTGAGRTTYERLAAYLDWCEEAVRQLRALVSPDDVERLVYGGRYRDLLLAVEATRTDHDRGTAGRSFAEAYDRPTAGFGQHPIVNGVLNGEFADRIQVLQDACDAFRAELDYWDRLGGLVMPDTSFYIEHPCKLEDVDFRQLLDFQDGEVHLVVPTVVVDELDGLKQHKERFRRWRASYTLAVLDRIWRDRRTIRRGVLSGADTAQGDSSDMLRTVVTVGLLGDPRGHARLPIADDEIVDRAATVRAVTGRPVKILTYDTGMSTRARVVGLEAIKLSKPIGDEPLRE